MGKKQRLKWAVVLILLFGIVGALTFAARGPYMSNYLKKLILRELHNATGRQVIARRIYLNFFPLFVGAEEIKIFDENGIRLATVGTAKAYIGVSAIFRREIELQRLYIGNTDVSMDTATIRDITSNINKYLERKKKKKPFFKSKIKVIEIRQSSFTYYDDEKRLIVSGKDTGALIRFRETTETDISMPELRAVYQELPELRCSLDATAAISKDDINLKKLRLSAYGSELGGSGFYLIKGKSGELNADIRLLVESVKEFFGLKKDGRGRISASGRIGLGADSWRDIPINFNLRGNFYLETLMELIKAHTESPVKGLVSFRGSLDGTLGAPTGMGTARLRNGNLFGVAIDDLNCRVNYSGGLLRFTEGKATLWGGNGEAEVSISIPHAKPYSVWAKVSGVDSTPLLELIRLKNLGLPLGKVDGELRTEGIEFNPEGWFSYQSSETLQNAIGRIRTLDGRFKMEQSVIALSDIRAKTGQSEILISGIFNTMSHALDLRADIRTDNIKDLTEPYFGRLAGSAKIQADVQGFVNAPAVNASLKASGLYLDGYRIGEAEAIAYYKTGLLEIKEARAESVEDGLKTAHALSGKVTFPKASGPLDLNEPQYDLKASVRNTNLAGIFQALEIRLPAEGRLFADLSIKGGTPIVSGTASLASGKVYGFPLEQASLGFMYDGEEISIADMVLKRGGSSVNASGKVSKAGRFSFSANSENLFLKDILSGFAFKRDISLNYRIRLNAHGEGTFNEPDIRLSAALTSGSVAGNAIGDGQIIATLKGKNANADIEIFGGLFRLNGKAELEGAIPWSAEAEFSKGRYDFLARAFLEELPADALLLMEGSARLTGTRHTVNADAVLKRLSVALYEQEFSNDADIKINVTGRRLSWGRVLMRGGDASFSIAGGMEIGRSFDIAIEGRTSLLPLAELSRRIDILRGKGNFVFSIKGPWDNPAINGGLDVSDGTLAIKGFPQRLTNINGYIYGDENRIYLERLSAKSGGGEIDVSGILYLKGFAIERVYMEALVNKTTFRPRKEFSLTLSGNLILKGAPEAFDLTGEVSINRALYTERVEWRTWLVSAKKQEAVTAKGMLDKVRLNLKVYGDEGIVIDNNIARAQLKADLVARGTLSRPVLYGRVEAIDGKVYFRNNEFRILSATADFSGTLTGGPYYTIVAETFSGGYHVWLTLEGYMEKFDLTLRSDPPLDEVSILALLTVGEFGGRLKGLEGGIGAAEATSFLTGKYQDVIEERFRTLTGLDRVQIDPYVSKATGTVVPKITVSKKLMADKLYVTYSTAMGTAEEQVLKLEYFLSSNLSLVGVRDERGSIGGDIKLRFKFK